MPLRRALCALAAVTGLACLGEGTWMHCKPLLARHLIERAWERTRRGEVNARPWPWADTAPVARLSVDRNPAHDVFVLEGASGRNLAFGPAHDSASVLPGERGNSVIAGHRDTSFRILQRLKVGDALRIERLRGSGWFRVSDVRVVDSRTTRIALAADAPRVTLVTCYPFDALVPGGPLRWVVTADWLPGT